MERVRLLVDLQLLTTLFLVAMLWLFSFRLHKQEFFRLWAWGWTSFALFLGIGASALRVGSTWAQFKQLTVLATTEVGFLQVPLLMLGAWSLRSGRGPTRRGMMLGLGLALGLGALSFAISLAHSGQPLAAYSWRSAPRTFLLATALVFCAWVFVGRWRADGTWTAAGPAIFCALYGFNQAVYSGVTFRYLILGPRTPAGGIFGLSLLLRPQWLFLDSTYTFGIGLGLVMLLLNEHEGTERSLLENEFRARQFAQDNAALRTEIEKRKLAEQELRSMSLRLVDAEEEERARIGRDLHDGMGAQLLLFMLDVGGLRQECSKMSLPLVRRVEKLQAIAGEIADSVRFVAHYLHSPSLELLGLSDALSEFSSEFARKSGMHVEFVRGDIPKNVPHDAALCIYRIAQEALQNVHKHSGSAEARVELTVVSRCIELRVSDKGTGFAPALAASGSGLGLVGMAERARTLGGQFSVESSPGHGTSVMASVPIRGSASV